MEQISLKTKKRIEFIDITKEVQAIVRKSSVKEGICFLYVPHTTAGITINEAADPAVASDIKNKLSEIAPESAYYLHTEGNADAHIKSSLLKCSAFIPIYNNSLTLGTWQGIFFCEGDGPRERKVFVRILC